jgi:hypothetical protein
MLSRNGVVGSPGGGIKLIRQEPEGHLCADDLADLTMQQLLNLRRELLAAASTTFS